MWSKAREAILNSSEQSSVYIGCDSLVSKKHGKFVAEYSTVIVVHRDSRHGCQIFHSSVTQPDYGIMETRLLIETQHALEAFDAIKDVIGNRHLEVHLDVNPNPIYKSNKVSSQALGWVRGQGIEVKIKPDSWAATHAADHCVRKKSSFSN